MKFTRGQILGKENKNSVMGSVDEKRITIKGLEPVEGNRYVYHNKEKNHVLSGHRNNLEVERHHQKVANEHY